MTGERFVWDATRLFHAATAAKKYLAQTSNQYNTNKIANSMPPLFFGGIFSFGVIGIIHRGRNITNIRLQ